MSLVLLLGLILMGVAVALAARSVSYTRDRRRETLAQVGAYGFTPARAEERATWRVARAVEPPRNVDRVVSRFVICRNPRSANC